MSTTTEKIIMTQREQIEERITTSEAKHQRLVAEAIRLGEQEYAAQSEGDRHKVLAVRARGKELPRLIGEAKAAMLSAMADLERYEAQELERQAEPIRGQMLTIDARIRQLKGERDAIRDRADSLLRKTKHHLLDATRYQHESNVLRQIHDPKNVEGR